MDSQVEKGSDFLAKRYTTIVIVYFMMLFSGSIGIPLVQAVLQSVGGMTKTESSSLAVVLWNIIANLITLLIIWLILRKQPEMNKIALGEKTSPGKSVLFSLGGMLALFVAQYVCFFIIALLIGVPGGSENTAELVALTKQAPIFLVFISILGPILEELIFRKVIYGGLSNIINIHVAAVISSFVFAILHGDIYYLLTYFVLGLILCFLYTKTKRITVSMGAHVLMNTIVMLINIGFWR